MQLSEAQKIGLIIGGGILAAVILGQLIPRKPIGLLPGTGTTPQNLSNATKNKIAVEMDQIYVKVIGANLFYYPEVINIILSYTTPELFFANEYYQSNYGESLRAALQGEWHAGYYDAAISKLKNAGL